MMKKILHKSKIQIGLDKNLVSNLGIWIILITLNELDLDINIY